MNNQITKITIKHEYITVIQWALGIHHPMYSVIKAWLTMAIFQ